MGHIGQQVLYVGCLSLITLIDPHIHERIEAES